MSKGSKVGWLLFLLLLCTRLYFNDQIPDGPTDIAMKKAGVYWYVLAALSCIPVGSLVWLFRQNAVIARKRDELARLQALLAQMKESKREN